MSLPKIILIQLGERGRIIKDNLDADAAPTVNDDGTKSYSYTSQWIDGAAGDHYVCLNNSEGAAVWKKTTP